MPEVKYDVPQRRILAQKAQSDFSEFWQLLCENSDQDFIKYLYRLMFRVYELHLENQYMTKMTACKYIPLSHAATCKKYLDIAEQNEFVIFERSETDKRKQLVKPGDKLIEFVEQKLIELGDEARVMTGQLLRHGRPKDNSPWFSPL